MMKKLEVQQFGDEHSKSMKSSDDGAYIPTCLDSNSNGNGLLRKTQFCDNLHAAEFKAFDSVELGKFQ